MSDIGGWYSEAYDRDDPKGASDYVGDLEERVEQAREVY